MSSFVVLQPAGNQGGREHYRDTVARPVSIQACEEFLSTETFRSLIQLHPDGQAGMWGVVPGAGDVNKRKWEKMTEGSLVLFSADGKIHTSAIVAMKFRSAKLAKHLWDVNADGETWEYMYSLDEIRNLNIPYQEFNRVVGYKENNIIQGFNVLDEEKSSLFLDHYGLRSEKHPEEVTDEEFQEALRELDGDLDRRATGWHRREQAHARKRLLKGKSFGVCLLCGIEMTSEFLIAAHIKRRSECSDDEKRDLAGVMMLACRFGCDFLYEEGLIGVDNSNLRISSKLTDPTALSYVQKIAGRGVEVSQNQRQYFEWHFSNRFKR